MKQYKRSETGGFVEVNENELAVDEKINNLKAEKNPNNVEEENTDKNSVSTENAKSEKITGASNTQAVDPDVADVYVWIGGIALFLTVALQILYGHGIGTGMMLFFFPFAAICVSLIGVMRRDISVYTRGVLGIIIVVAIIGFVGSFFMYSLETGMGRKNAGIRVKTENTTEYNNVTENISGTK